MGTRTALDALVESPVHPANRYTVPPTVTVSGTVAVAGVPASYQPPPCGVPYGLTTVSRYCVRHVAVTVLGGDVWVDPAQPVAGLVPGADATPQQYPAGPFCQDPRDAL